VKLPGKETLERSKLLLEVIVLLIFIPVLLFVVGRDREAALRLAGTAK
jgi:ABC-type transport system involved in cytochrome c biogenesis permease component